MSQIGERSEPAFYFEESCKAPLPGRQPISKKIKTGSIQTPNSASLLRELSKYLNHTIKTRDDSLMERNEQGDQALN